MCGLSEPLSECKVPVRIKLLMELIKFANKKNQSSPSSFQLLIMAAFLLFALIFVLVMLSFFPEKTNQHADSDHLLYFVSPVFWNY